MQSCISSCLEYITTGNVSTNGETQFEHVMMKMVPGANGTTVNLTDRVPYVLNQSVNLSGTHIEGWNDLGVVVIFQNYSTKGSLSVSIFC